MVNQKPISLKIEFDLLDELDKEVSLGWRKRNNHINEAIRLYLAYKDSRRRVYSYGSVDDKRKEARDFIKKWFPELIDW